MAPLKEMSAALVRTKAALFAPPEARTLLPNVPEESIVPLPASVNWRLEVTLGVWVSEKMAPEPVYWSVPPLKTRAAAVAPRPSGLAAPAFHVVVAFVPVVAGSAKATVPAPIVTLSIVLAMFVSDCVPPPAFTS